MNSPEPPGLLAALLAEPLATCRTAITRWRRNPAPARIKRNISGRPEPVTDLDEHVQDQLTAAAHRHWPNLPVVGEERRAHLGPLPADCLLIDPIDGTAPLLAGQPFYAIAVCLVRHGRPDQAVIDLPAFGLTVSVTDQCLHVDGDQHALPTFAPTDVLTSPGQVDEVTARLHSTGALAITARPVPTATIKLLLVALRHATAAVYLRGHAGAAPWDFAAAALAVSATGATIHDDHGRDLARTLPTRIDGWAATAAGTSLPTDALFPDPVQET